MSGREKTSGGPKGAKRPRTTGFSVLRSSQADREARRVAVLILEVLAGVKTPTESAELLGVSLTRYYALESRALVGFLEACQRRSKGPRKDPERELGKLRRQIDRLERDCARSQALLRVAQRAVGLSAKSSRPTKPEGGKKRRKRRPVRRALRVVKALQDPEEKSVEEPGRPSDNLRQEELAK